MRHDLDDRWVATIWNHSVIPYLEERFFGESDRLAEFTLDALTPSAQRFVDIPEDADGHVDPD
jgi:hypothetical protein